ncbi:MAG: thiamine-phosphate kinase [Hyphomicrobiaceae bacterium]
MGGTRIKSEDDLVGTFLAPLAAGFAGALGLKDDCAVLAPTPGCELVLKTDPVVAGVHFLADDDPADIAWKALAVNVSDLAAKGAMPRIYLMALSLPETPERDWMARFADGLGAAQRAFGIHLAGGDTDRTPGHLSIAITVVGEVPAGRMVRRAAAESGDALYVSGTLGDAALGLALRLDGALAARLGLRADEVAHAIRRYMRPAPRLALAPVLRDYARAAMDLSDGLMKDLGRMCRAAGVGAQVLVADLPLSPAVRRALDMEPARIRDVVAAGDDYEILAAVPPAACADFELAARRAGVAVTRIGAITSAREVCVLDAQGVPLAPGRSGWDHFEPR